MSTHDVGSCASSRLWQREVWCNGGDLRSVWEAYAAQNGKNDHQHQTAHSPAPTAEEHDDGGEKRYGRESPEWDENAVPDKASEPSAEERARLACVGRGFCHTTDVLLAFCCTMDGKKE